MGSTRFCQRHPLTSLCLLDRLTADSLIQMSFLLPSNRLARGTQYHNTAAPAALYEISAGSRVVERGKVLPNRGKLESSVGEQRRW
jgi:hypothetical protein